jgi:hypothetical protein
MQAINNAFAGLNKGLTNIMENPYVSTALIVFALVFASLAAPNLPPFLVGLFDNTYFKIFYLFMILVLLQYNVGLALIAALVFVLALQSLQRYRAFSYAQDRLQAIPGTVRNFIGDVGEVGKVVGNQLQAIPDAAENLLEAPGQLVSSVKTALTSIPSAFSTSIDSATYMTEEQQGSAACPIPASCQSNCGGQPMEPTALPPVENTEVSGICSPCGSYSPQGLRFPPGYENLGMGYDITATQA